MAKQCKTITISNCPPNDNCDGCVDIIKSQCIKYQGDNISCVGIDKGDNLEEIIVQLSSVICTLSGSGGGECCDLQGTTDVGNKTTNDIEMSDETQSIAHLILSYQNDPLRPDNPTIKFQSGGSTYSTYLGTSEDGTGENGSANDNYIRLPYVTGETRVLAASVNGIEADTTGNIEVPDSRPYKVYTALLHQTGINAPIAEIVENTLGQNIIWTRGNIGAYYGNFDTYIPNNNEVIVFVNGSRDDIIVSAFFDNGEINLLKRQLYVDFQLEEYGYSEIDNFQFIYIEIRVYD